MGQERAPKRYFIAVDMKARSYTVVDRISGQGIMTVYDPNTAVEYCAIVNRRDEQEQAQADARARASGRPT